MYPGRFFVTVPFFTGSPPGRLASAAGSAHIRGLNTCSCFLPPSLDGELRTVLTAVMLLLVPLDLEAILAFCYISNDVRREGSWQGQSAAYELAVACGISGRWAERQARRCLARRLPITYPWSTEGDPKALPEGYS